MLIIEISEQSFPSNHFLEEDEIEIRKIRPSLFSFYTSMKIASTINKKWPDAIIVNNAKNALAAISALKISKKSGKTLHVPIIMSVDKTSDIPRSIARDVISNIDALIFDDDAIMRKWDNVRNLEYCRKKITIPYPAPELLNPTKYSYSEESANTSESEKKENPEKLKFIFLGPIVEPNNLKESILKLSGFSFLDNSESSTRSSGVELRILGTGKARTVMPIVKLAQKHNVEAVWVGDEYDLDDEILKADGFISQSDTLTKIEKSLLSGGIPNIKPSELNEFLNNGNRVQKSREALNLYRSQYQPKLFSHRIKDLIRDIKTVCHTN